MTKTIKSNEGNTAIDANTLCQSCGICCDGTLFSYVSLKKGENEEFKDLPLDIYEKSKGKFAFKQACPCLSNSSCTTYLRRPATCKSFICETQRVILNGSVPLSEGEIIIAQIKELVVWIKENADVKPVKGFDNTSFREYLVAYINHVNTSIENGLITDNQADFVQKIFEYTKMVDRYFQETSLLPKYATLVQKINSQKSD